ncbi:MAG: hypothetical protein LAO20_01980 [Acidobacteriia bacterium]|nr:hypothetical protein [Terriglobia bacterium]
MPQCLLCVFDAARIILIVVVFGANPVLAQKSPQVTLEGTLYSVDAEAPVRAARIQVQLLPLLEPLENSAPGRCASLKRNPEGPIYKLVTDSAGGFALNRLVPGQYFLVVTSATESFDLISTCLTVTGPEESKSCGSKTNAPASEKQNAPLVPTKASTPATQLQTRQPQAILVRYSNRMKSYHGDILVSHPCAERRADVCDSLHETRPLTLAARQILLQRGGEPMAKAVVRVARASQKEGATVSLTADAHGILDAGPLYSLAEGTGNVILLLISVAGESAKILVQVAAEPTTAKQTLSLFQRRKCGWEAEVIN